MRSTWSPGTPSSAIAAACLKKSACVTAPSSSGPSRTGFGLRASSLPPPIHSTICAASSLSTPGYAPSSSQTRSAWASIHPFGIQDELPTGRERELVEADAGDRLLQVAFLDELALDARLEADVHQTAAAALRMPQRAEAERLGRHHPQGRRLARRRRDRARSSRRKTASLPASDCLPNAFS